MSAPSRSSGWAQSLLPVAVLAILLSVAAVPALAADPSPAPHPPGQDVRPDHAGPKDKTKEPKNPITLRGTVVRATDEDGNAVYELVSGGKTYTLDAGPSWFLRENHPLESRVGDTLTIGGTVAAGSTEVDVETIDGKAIRDGGKPAWAGGWKRVGQQHPGWSEEKAALMAEKLAARQLKFDGCFPPGHCKQTTNASD